ncbi:hypothetical protein L208DRAFT_1284811 [Tricholoma matsutake]|nr:hypothetical protein L208DRAFT_1284811 [Tricholoma matsutake 945]
MIIRPTLLAQRLLSTACVSQTSQLSTTHRGTAFEERSLKILHDHMSMSLRRVGGKSDGGIDLVGWWWLPPTDTSVSESRRRRIRVIAQCKAEKKKTSPKYVREMEGVLHRFISLPPIDGSVGSETPDQFPTSGSHSLKYPLVALLISESPFTKSTVLRAQSSPVPFFLLHIPPATSIAGYLEQQFGEDCVGAAVWNPALAGVGGLLGGEFETRWERSPSGGGRPGLWWRNEKLRSWIPEGSLSDSDKLSLAPEDKE